MSTNNRRVAAYLPQELEDAFSRFKVSREMGDSQALITILSEFFGVSQTVAHSVDISEFATKSQLEALKSDVVVLSKKLDDLYIRFNSGSLTSIEEGVDSPVEKESPLVESVSEVLHDYPIEPSLDESNAELTVPQLAPEVVLEKLDSLTTKEISFLASDLAKRLNVGGSTISQRKNDSPERFADWTRSKDPDGIAWCFISQMSCFVPIGDIPIEIKKQLIKVSPEGFTTSELAKRLGIDKTTLSHWKSATKKGKSPSELLRATREKDPDGIGWEVVPETGRFKPEKELPNRDSLSMLQGSLLSEEPLNQVNPDSPIGSKRSGEG